MDYIFLRQNKFSINILIFLSVNSKHGVEVLFKLQLKFEHASFIRQVVDKLLLWDLTFVWKSFSLENIKNALDVLILWNVSILYLVNCIQIKLFEKLLNWLGVLTSLKVLVCNGVDNFRLLITKRSANCFNKFVIADRAIVVLVKKFENFFEFTGSKDLSGFFQNPLKLLPIELSITVLIASPE